MKKQFASLLFAIAIFLSNPVAIKAQVDVNDSLALVDLYNSTNGPSWNFHNGWLTGPVKYWYGISLSGNDVKRVSRIELYSNYLTGFIPSSIGKLSKLVLLGLTYNQLSGNIPPELGNLSNLSSLGLYDNQLSGNIPPELGNLSKLVELELSYNQLSGNIPPELGNLSNLSSLGLYDNQLSGNIPPELGNLSKLVELELSYNQLSGNIPPELGKLSTLDYLDLSYNKLSGAIPSEFGNLSNLDYLYLNNNQLSGAIPSALGNLYTNIYLYLFHNRFTFDGMELIVKKLHYVKFERQALIPVHLHNNALSVSAGGTLKNNIYLWFKKGRSDTTTIKGDSVFHPTESGVYAVLVRNKTGNQLKLESRIIKYSAPPINATASAKLPESSNTSFFAYPNPAKDILHVTTNGKASVSLLNLSGEILLNEEINKTGSIHINGIAAGVYYLKNNNTNALQKVVIVK